MPQANACADAHSDAHNDSCAFSHGYPSSAPGNARSDSSGTVQWNWRVSVRPAVLQQHHPAADAEGTKSVRSDHRAIQQDGEERGSGVGGVQRRDSAAGHFHCTTGQEPAADPEAAERRKLMKLYLWRVVMTDYTDGCAFAIAESKEAALAHLQITPWGAHSGDYPSLSEILLSDVRDGVWKDWAIEKWPEPEVHELTEPFAFWRSGGG